MNWTVLLLVIIAVLLALCGLRLTEISGALQDVAYRARRFYPLTDSESEEAAEADEAEAWARSSRHSA